MSILHLSDIHFGRNYKCYGLKDEFDKKEAILSDLIECIKNVDKEFKVEHIIVTGDIAWYGKRKEFEEALRWFKLLLNAIGLNGKDITFCVGNHDVNRNYSSIDTKFNHSYMISFGKPMSIKQCIKEIRKLKSFHLSEK